VQVDVGRRLGDGGGDVREGEVADRDVFVQALLAIRAPRLRLVDRIVVERARDEEIGRDRREPRGEFLIVGLERREKYVNAPNRPPWSA